MSEVQRSKLGLSERIWHIIDPTSIPPEVQWRKVAVNTIVPLTKRVQFLTSQAWERLNQLRTARQQKRQSRKPLEDEYPHTFRDSSYRFGWADNSDTPEAKALKKLRRV